MSIRDYYYIILQGLVGMRDEPSGDGTLTWV